MTDRKTVMSWLEGLTWDDWPEWHSDSEVRETAKAAIAMLKEQDEQIRIKTENFNRLVAKIEVMPEIVRCKDCRWGDWSRNGKGEKMILCYNGDTGIEDGYLHEPHWFCAEGVAKDPADSSLHKGDDKACQDQAMRKLR